MNKIKIPATVRNNVWNQHIGVEIGTYLCCCCKSEPITKANFECGHIISTKNGGSCDLSNLKPICKHCNTSMGTQNMHVFMKQYGFDKLTFNNKFANILGKNNDISNIGNIHNNVNYDVNNNVNNDINNNVNNDVNNDDDDNDDDDIDYIDYIDDVSNFEIKTQTTTTYNLRSLYDQYIKINSLNLSPEYQREFVWNKNKQNLLIDSIMRNFIMPPVILINIQNCNNNYDYECIDGQHRLRVIKNYITGEKINGNHVKWIRKNNDGNIECVFYEKNYNTAKAKCKGKRYMTDIEKKKFNSYKISAIELMEKLSFDKICVIFSRLQNGEKTSVLDKFKNLDHPIPALLRKLDACNFENFKKTNIGINIFNLFNNFFKSHTLTSSKKKKYITIIMIFSMIYAKGLDNIISFYDLNIIKDIELNNNNVDISIKNTDDIIINLDNILNNLCLLVKEIKDTYISVPMFYILSDIYCNYEHNNFRENIKKIIESKYYAQYNSEEIFNYQNKNQSNEMYVHVRNIFVEYLCNNIEKLNISTQYNHNIQDICNKFNNYLNINLRKRNKGEKSDTIEIIYDNFCNVYGKIISKKDLLGLFIQYNYVYKYNKIKGFKVLHY
jgi:hypothetical protein